MTACANCGARVPEDARFCPTCGAAAEAIRVPPEERKLATVLFADLVGSTALADAEDPERVRARLDLFYDAMTEQIERTGGTVESFAGDSVMAAFGAPSALEDHAERALHAALAMQRRLAELDHNLALRIGVNTGEVVFGRAREGTSFVSGDAVNVGARLEQAAAPGEVLAGERTVAAARGAFEFGDRRSVVAKGKRGGLACRPVLRALSLMRPRGVGGMRRVFVGRESELELLRAIFRRAVDQGEPHLVSIVGEPGVGKTRLVRELWDLLAADEPTPLRRTGRCLAYGDGITYWPLGEILKEQLGILDSDPPERIRERLGEREILGLALGLDVAGDLHPLDAREQLHQAVVGLVEQLSAERPLVMLVEDIHWAEDDLLDLLERVVRDARGPIVLIATARPELLTRRREWGAGRRNATTIWLEALRAEVTSRMLEELLSIELPEALGKLIVEKAEGNPFFLEELVAELVDAGVLERRDGTWRTHELPEGFAVPDSVHAVLAARIDRLPPPEKAALQAASVVGRVFWAGPVVHLLDGAETNFELLEERDFIRSRGGSTMAGEHEYAIKHALTREVAYASIPKARRGRLHASLADWLESRGSGKDEHASLLAYHYAEAVRSEDADLVWVGAEDELLRLRTLAVARLRRAGELARGRYELDEAVELLTRAVELADDERDRALVWGELGRVQALRYDGAAFWSAMHRALEGPLTPGERADVYSLLAFQTSIRSGMWTTRPRREQVYVWSDHALELADDGSVARAQALLARANADPGEASAEVLEDASTLAERIGDPRLRSYAFGVRSHAAYDRLNFDDAAEWTARRLELLPEIADPDHRTETLEDAVPVMSANGRFAQAKRLVAEHWEISQRLSAHHRVHSVSLGLELADATGDWASIVADTDRVVQAVEANRATPCVRNARDLLLLALAHACLGDEERARAFERDAAPLAGEGHERSLNPPRLRLALVREDAERVRELVGLAPFRTFVWGPSVFGTWVDALLALGEHDAIEREAPGFLQAGTVPEPFALRALGAARGDDELLARADERFRELGLDWHAAQTERLLAGF